MCGGADTGYDELLPMAPRYKNKKTGGVYIRLANGVDCTNSRSGLGVVVYCPEENGNSVFVRELSEFVRELSEFESKFEIVGG